MSDNTGANDLTPPLTKERIISALRSLGVRCWWDEDAVCYICDKAVFVITCEEDSMLSIIGQWNEPISLDYREELLNICNEINNKNYLLSSCVKTDDNGNVSLSIEASVPLVLGVSDEQLTDFLGSILANSHDFITQVARSYDPNAGFVYWGMNE